MFKWLTEYSPLVFRLGLFRRFFLGLPLDRVEYANQDDWFQGGEPDTARRLERVGKCALFMYNMGIEEADPDALNFRLQLIDRELGGFAAEGAAMGLMTLDLLSRGDRAFRFLNGPANRHEWLCYIGAGMAHAAVRRAPADFHSTLDPFFGWLLYNGYGFLKGELDTDATVRNHVVPTHITGPGIAEFHTGVGRSLWFVECADIARIQSTIESFAEEWHADMWSGVAFACTYAGGVQSSDIERLIKAAGPHRGALCEGSALAATLRDQVDAISDAVDLATGLLVGVSGKQAAKAALTLRTELDSQSEDESDEPLWFVWRRRLQTILVE